MVLSMLSIIIITYNEEEHLPRLLSSINNQKYKDFELIVSDAKSKDRTVAIAKEYGCKIISGPRLGPSYGRNLGAKVAGGDHFLFLDADVALTTKDCLEHYLSLFKSKHLAAATVNLEPDSGKIVDQVMYHLWNAWQMLTQKTDPHALGAFILVNKSVFEKIGGFDESVKYAEDAAFARKSKEFGKFAVLKGPSLLVSTRRLESQGRIRTAYNLVAAGIYRTIFGEIKRKKHFTHQAGDCADVVNPAQINT